MPPKIHYEVDTHAISPLPAIGLVDSDSSSEYKKCPQNKEDICIALLTDQIASQMSGVAIDTAPVYGCLSQCTFKNILSKIKSGSREKSFPALLSDQDLIPSAVSTLTAREHEILLLLSSSDSAKVIAINLNVSKHTLNEHISNIYRKLSVTNRIAATNIK